MAMKLSPKGMLKMEAIEEATRKMDRIRGFVEQYAVAKRGQDVLLIPMRRTATDVSRVLLTGGFVVIADSAKQIAQIARPGGNQHTKARSFRELVGRIYAALERATKAVRAEESKQGSQEAD